MRHEMHPVIGGSAGDDSIEVGGKLLSFFETFAAARRTTVPIRRLRRIAIVRGDDALRLHSHLIHRAITEVRQFLGMAERKLTGSTFVTGIRAPVAYPR